jgi:hypothetical protein
MPYETARGRWNACLYAGPVFVASLVGTAFAENPAQPLSLPVHWAEMVGGIILMIMPVILIGMLLAFVPVWLGTNLLAWAGNSNAGLRHPALWAISGGAVVAIPTIMFGAGEVFPQNLSLIATGAVCAVIARYGTRWSDDSV